MIKKIPFSRIFFETDDATFDINEIYAKAALLKDRDIEIFKKLIYNNFISIFGAQLHD